MHWQNRPEKSWRRFRFNQPYAKGLQRLKEQVLAKTDFDPATLWQWGTMQAMAVIEILKENEKTFGQAGQDAAYRALKRIGLDVGRQILAGVDLPHDITDVELASFYATVVNRIAYASLEAPRIQDDNSATFEILWCPHQDHYAAFDCRVQRYLVQGMIEALEQHAGQSGIEVRFDTTIPAGAPVCHFTLWKGDEADRRQWEMETARLNQKALQLARCASDDHKASPTE